MMSKNPSIAASEPKTFTPEEFQRTSTILSQKLGVNEMSERAGPGGRKVQYMETWKAIEQANRIFGFNGWNSQIIEISDDYIENQGKRWNCGYSAIIRVTLKDGSFHEDIGYGCSKNQGDRGKAIEMAKKKAVSDAVKRALKNFGHQLGLSIYDRDHLREVKRGGKRRAQNLNRIVPPPHPPPHQLNQRNQRHSSHLPSRNERNSNTYGNRGANMNNHFNTNSNNNHGQPNQPNRQGNQNNNRSSQQGPPPQQGPQPQPNRPGNQSNFNNNNNNMNNQRNLNNNNNNNTMNNQRNLNNNNNNNINNAQIRPPPQQNMRNNGGNGRHILGNNNRGITNHNNGGRGGGNMNQNMGGGGFNRNNSNNHQSNPPNRAKMENVFQNNDGNVEFDEGSIASNTGGDGRITGKKRNTHPTNFQHLNEQPPMKKQRT